VPPERPTTGYTPNELGRLLRVSPDRIRRWIAAGELGAINTAPSRLSKPRFIVLPHHLAEFERSRAAAAPKPAVRRRRRAEVKEGRCASRRLTRCRRMVKPFRPAAASVTPPCNDSSATSGGTSLVPSRYAPDRRRPRPPSPRRLERRACRLRRDGAL